MSKLLRAGIVSIREPLPIPLSELPAPQPQEEEPEEETAEETADASALLEAAREQAAEIRRQAARDADALYAQAREAGLAEGRRRETVRSGRAARDTLRREAAQQKDRLDRFTAGLEERLSRTRADVRAQAMAMGFALAGHMLRAEIDRNAPQFSGLAEKLFPLDDDNAAGREAAGTGNGGDAVA